MPIYSPVIGYRRLNIRRWRKKWWVLGSIGSKFKELFEFATNAHSHGFLTIKLKSKSPQKMFASDFSRWLHPT